MSIVDCAQRAHEVIAQESSASAMVDSTGDLHRAIVGEVCYTGAMPRTVDTVDSAQRALEVSAAGVTRTARQCATLVSHLRTARTRRQAELHRPPGHARLVARTAR